MPHKRSRRLLLACALSALAAPAVQVGALFEETAPRPAAPLAIQFTHSSESGGVHGERFGLVGGSGRPFMPGYALHYEYQHLTFDPDAEVAFPWRAHRVFARVHPFQWGPWGLEAAAALRAQSGLDFQAHARWALGLRTRLQWENLGFALAVETDPILSLGARFLPSVDGWGKWKGRFGLFARIAYMPTLYNEALGSSLAWKIGGELLLLRAFTPFAEVKALGNDFEFALGLHFQPTNISPLVPTVRLRAGLDLMGVFRGELTLGFALGVKAPPVPPRGPLRCLIAPLQNRSASAVYDTWSEVFPALLASLLATEKGLEVVEDGAPRDAVYFHRSRGAQAFSPELRALLERDFRLDLIILPVLESGPAGATLALRVLVAGGGERLLSQALSGTGREDLQRAAAPLARQLGEMRAR